MAGAPRVSLPVVDALAALDARVEARARAAQEAHPWWPCREGCDDCCRSLSRLPVVTEPEWARLREAILALEPAVRDAIALRTEAARDERPVQCPMLDTSRRSCLVYAARPVACRTYGFYTERDGGLHCAKVTAAVDANAPGGDVVWGNGEAVAHDLRAVGEAVSLRAWMRTLR